MKLVICSLLFIIAELRLPAAPLLAQSVNAGAEIGKPIIRNYSPKEYRAHNQNWAIVQDHRGMIYVGNWNGVLEYDGVSWRLISIPGDLPVRSLAVDDSNTIYVGARGDFGYLAPDATGALQFVSLLDSVTIEDRDFQDVFETLAAPSGVYFRAHKRLFRWSGNQMYAWRTTSLFRMVFLVNDRLYSREPGVGLVHLAGDSLWAIPNSKRVAEAWIMTMLPYEGNAILVGSPNQGMFIFDGETVQTFETEVDTFIARNQLNCGVRLPDGAFALGTESGGVAIIDRHGRRLRLLDRAAGLQDNSIHDAYCDRQGGLWLALENGVSRIEIGTPLSTFDEESGLKGTVLHMTRHQGRLYLATMQGVFFLENKPSMGGNGVTALARRKFRPVSGIQTHCWFLLSIGNSLLAGTSAGVYRIDGDKATYVKESINRSYVAGHLHRSQQDANRLYVALGDGLASLRFSNGQWMDEGRINGVHEEIYSIAETTPGILWLGTQFQGVLRADFTAEQNKHFNASPTVQRFGAEHGLPKGGASVFSINGRMLFATPKGIFRFEENGKIFKRDTTFEVVAFGGTHEEYSLSEDHQGNVWINLGRESAVARPQNDGTYFFEKAPFLPFSDLQVNDIYPEKNGVVWFGGPDGLIRYDGNIAEHGEVDYPALIRRVTIGMDSVLFAGETGGVAERPVARLPYGNSVLRFEYAALSFVNESSNRFQTMLEGFEGAWAPWTTEAYKDYTHLPEGKYRFRVRARNIYERMSAEDAYAFEILPPFYGTWWAYLFYLFLSSAAVWGLIKLQVYRVQRVERARSEQRSQLRQELAADFHDGAGDKLAQISLFSKFVKSQLQSDSREINNALEWIVEASNNLKAEARDFIWALDVEKDSLYDVAARLQEHSETLMQKAQPAVTFVISGVTNRFREVALPMDWKRHLIFIFRESLNNVFKYAQARQVAFEFKLVHDHLEICLCDDGKGFDPAAVHSGKGLANMKQRAEKLGGRLSIESAKGKGTTIRFSGVLPPLPK